VGKGGDAVRYVNHWLLTNVEKADSRSVEIEDQRDKAIAKVKPIINASRPSAALASMERYRSPHHRLVHQAAGQFRWHPGLQQDR